jgi:hypothetical protein
LARVAQQAFGEHRFPAVEFFQPVMRFKRLRL